MADRDNGKVEHPLTLGPKYWEEDCGCVCVSVRAGVHVWDQDGGCRVEGKRGMPGKKRSRCGLQSHTFACILEIKATS